MISWTKLLTGKSQDHDTLRYSMRNNYAPKIVVWNTTSRCNLRCKHCYFGAAQNQDPNELSQKEAEDFIKDLAELGVSVLLFSGGEPLLRNNIFDLGKFAEDNGIRTALSTNGTLITPEVAEKIKEAGFSYVGVSLDGKEKTNDDFRQNKGAFKAAISGIRDCKKTGLKVGLRLTLTKYNLADIPHIFNIIESESIERLCLYHLVYTGRGENLKHQDINHQERRQVLEFIWQKAFNFNQKGLNTEILTVDNHADGVWIYLKLMKNDPERARIAFELLKVQGGNSAGMRIAGVDNLGNVYPDQFWQIDPLGNVKDRSFSSIWMNGNSELLKKLRNRKKFLKGRCSKCGFLDICNGNFRIRAKQVYGDIWQEDPSCYLTDKEICTPFHQD